MTGGAAGFQPPKIMAAVAMRCDPDSREPSFDGDSAIDLSAGLDTADGTLTLDLPEGYWRVFLLLESRNGGRDAYMNLLDPESIRIEIDAVHEVHYQQMKDELGKTWEGFFYDEPEVGNAKNYDFDNLPGRSLGAMPWSREMPALMAQRLGEDWMLHLPELWYDCGPHSHVTRFHFMDLVTRLIAENYNGQVQAWCRERNIRYIGHVLEDEGSHARLGCGPGHFFRFQKHQDMAGIDVIGGQLMPGMNIKGTGWYSASEGDGTFYHYGIAKLPSSEAYLNPDKQGQSFCEINAVYNNVSNPKLYKYLLDHLLVDGVNNLVPVFTDVVDPDEGKLLFDYVNRLCSLMHKAVHVAPVALLYHAEAEWTGAAQPFHVPGKVLAQHQLDYTVTPGDVFVDTDFYHTRMENGLLKVNTEAFRAVVVPACDYIRADVLNALLTAQKAGLQLIFVDRAPMGYCESLQSINWQETTPAVVPLAQLGSALDELAELRCGVFTPDLKYIHLKKENLEYYFLMNTAYQASIETAVRLPQQCEVMQYDAMCDAMRPVCCRAVENGMELQVTLGQWESILYVLDPSQPMGENTVPGTWTDADCGPWQLSFEGEHAPVRLNALSDVSRLPGLRRYTQPIRYETVWTVTGPLPTQLSLGRVGDSARVTLNGKALGLRIAEPYVFDLGDAVCAGANELIIEVLPAQGRRVNAGGGSIFDALGAATYMTMQPTGLLGPVRRG